MSPPEVLPPPPPARLGSFPPRAARPPPSSWSPPFASLVLSLHHTNLIYSTATQVLPIAPAAATTTGPGRRRRYCRRSPRPGSRRGQRPGRRRRRLCLPARARVQARADGCPVGAPRAVMNIKHPCKPKPACRGIPTAILPQDGWQDFKCAGITLVYTRYIPGLEIADSEKISLVYPSHILFT